MIPSKSASRLLPCAIVSRQFFASSFSAQADKPFERIQDPTQTRQSYSQPEGEGRRVPTPADDGLEREVKWGGNIPASMDQAKDELKDAGKGLAESVEMGVNVLLSKGKDAVAAAQRAVGLSSEHGHMSEGTMGAAGKMEHAPPGSQTGGASVDAENARSKYDEVAGTEKQHYRDGEQSVNNKFPDMASAARQQINPLEQQRQENEEIRRDLHSPGGSGDTQGGTGRGDTGAEDMLSDSLHNRGP